MKRRAATIVLPITIIIATFIIEWLTIHKEAGVIFTDRCNYRLTSAVTVWNGPTALNL